MTKISRRGNKPVFTGIVAVGDNKTTACNAYRSAVRDHSLSMYSESSVLCALAGEGCYSPATGRMMKPADEYKSKLTSQSSNGDAALDVDVHVSVCTDGCNKVLVSDQEIDFCTVCSTALPELSDDEVIEALADLESESNFDNEDNYMTVQGNQGLLVVASSMDEAQALFAEACLNPQACTHMTDGEAVYATHAECETEYSPFNGEASYESEEEDEDLAQELSSVSSMAEDGDIEANYLMCVAGCANPHIITSNENASYCPTCSGGLVDPEVVASLSGLDDEDELSIEDDEDLDDDFDDEDDFESESGADEDEDDFDDDFEDLEDDEDFESESSSDELDEDDMEDIEDDLEDLEDDEDFESDSSVDDLFSASSDDDEDDLEDDIDDFDDEDDLEDLDDDFDDEDDFDSESHVLGETTVDFLEAYAGYDEELHDPKLVSFSHVGKVAGQETWLAFYNGMPVARALQAQATNQALFNSPKFGEAALTAVASQGLVKALSDFNFEVLNPEVDLQTSISSKMVSEHKRELAELQSSVDNEVAEVKERFGAALATSCAAINRNLVKGKTNPIAQSLIASLKAAGVSTAEQLVSQSFELHSDAFMREALDHATNLMSKSTDAQNEYAEMVSTASFNSASNASVTIGTVVPKKDESPAQSQPQMTSESSAPAVSDFQSRLDRSFSRL